MSLYNMCYHVFGPFLLNKFKRTTLEMSFCVDIGKKLKYPTTR